MIKYAPGASDADKVARSWVGRSYPAGWCLAFQATKIFRVPGVGDYDGDGDADAVDYWKAAKARGKVVETTDPKKIPAGVMILWSGGSHGYGHAAYSLGAGKIVTTDLPTRGKVGIVTTAQVARSWGLKLLGYVLVDGNGFTLTKAAEAKPAAPTATELKVPVMLMPLAGYNAPGAPGVTEWERNVAGALKLVTKHKPTILGVTELSNLKANPMLPAFDKGATAYTRRGGSDGRYPYLRDSHVVQHVADGVFQAPKATLLNGDTKQCGWTVDELQGLEGSAVVAVGVMHAENQNGKDTKTGRDADDLRVDQVLAWEKQLRAKAKEHGADHVLLMGDPNSRSAVRDALVRRGWTACPNPGRATGWDHEGGPVSDWIFVLDGELESDVEPNPYSDHTIITATWTITIPPPAGTYRVTTHAGLNLRASASTSAAIVGTARYGDKLTIVSTKSAGDRWWGIDADGRAVALDYTELVE